MPRGSVEKTDRLYRNFVIASRWKTLGVEIYLPKEGQIIGKNSKTEAKLPGLKAGASTESRYTIS